jgi:uncharacterized cupredoxin-like copper-binding protein
VIPAIGAQASASKTITIKVTASEFKFALSKKSVPVGTTVIFKVTNKGKIPHDFKINGKKTQTIQPGKAKSIKVVFKKKGRFGYVCTIDSHARLGMKGTFSVGVKPVTTGTGTTGGTTTGGGTSCTSPTATVTVGMREYAFDLSRQTVPAGCVQFVVTNLPNSVEFHNFDLVGVHVGAVLSPGRSETWNVQLSARGYAIQCDVGQHAAFGMVAALTVT